MPHVVFVLLDFILYCSSLRCFNAVGCVIGMIFLHHTTTVLWPFFRDHPGEPVPEVNFWTLWCKGRLTEAETPTIRLGSTPSGLASAHLHHPPIFFKGQMPFLPPSQQCQSTEGSGRLTGNHVSPYVMTCNHAAKVGEAK